LTRYDAKQTEDIFNTNAVVGIPEEVTALGIATKYGKEKEWNSALATWKKGVGFRQTGKGLQNLVHEVCDPQETGIPQVHDYDEKHLVVEGISAVDADGNVVKSYPQLLVMKDVFRNEKGNIINFTSYRAIRHCEQAGYFLPSSNLTIPLVAALFQHRNNPKVNNVLMQYKDKGNGNGWHAQNTVIDYKNQNMISYPSDSDFPIHDGSDNINASQTRIELPFKKVAGIWPFDKKLEDMTLEKDLTHALVSTFVKQFMGMADPSILFEIGKYFQKPAYLWFSADVQSCTEIRATWFGCSGDNFYLYGDYYLNNNYAARGVREL